MAGLELIGDVNSVKRWVRVVLGMDFGFGVVAHGLG
jgi:hypothetical protein